MRTFPIDVEIRLSVRASSLDEAKKAVICGLKYGLYAEVADIHYSQGDSKNRSMVVANPFNVPAKDSDVNWVVENYGSVVRIGESMTGAEFAAKIRIVYDCENSLRNRLAAKYAEEGLCEIRRTVGDRISYRLAKGVATA